MAALRPRSRNAGQASKPAVRRDRDAGDAEAPRRKVEEPELENALMREVAEAFAASKGGYGYRRVKAMLRTGVSEKVIRRIMAEDGPTAHVPERCGYGSYEGETTPAPGNLADRDFTAEAPDEKWPGWLDLMDRCGLTRSTGAKGCSPDNAAAEGFFGRMKTESVYPGRWEERTRDEVLAPVDDCIRWHDHGRIKRSLGWMSPVQYRQSQGMAA